MATDSFITKLVKPMFLSNYLSKTGNFEKNIFPADIKFQNIYLTTEDNCKIGCWLLQPVNPKTESMNHIVFLHGTGSNRIDFCKCFHIINIVRMDFCILIPDYRDFGDSEGDYNVKMVNYDVDACVDFMVNKFKRNVHLIGYSLGAAVALEYMRYLKKDKIIIPELNKTDALHESNEKIGKVVLIAPFHSTLRILKDQWLWCAATCIFPFASAKVEREFNYNSIDNIKLLDEENVFLLHGKKDKMVNYSHALDIYKTFKCKFYSGEKDDHFSLMTKIKCWGMIDNFLRQ